MLLGSSKKRNWSTSGRQAGREMQAKMRHGPTGDKENKGCKPSVEAPTCADAVQSVALPCTRLQVCACSRRRYLVHIVHVLRNRSPSFAEIGKALNLEPPETRFWR